jgi:8-amino-7-oxononanoate synthase
MEPRPPPWAARTGEAGPSGSHSSPPLPPPHGGGSGLPGPWAPWLDGALGALSAAHLLRELRPVDPVASSATSVSVPAGVLADWVVASMGGTGLVRPAGGEDRGAGSARVVPNPTSVPVAHTPSSPPPPLPPPPSTLVRLFSTNDYLGLSAHPTVRAAAAAAAADVGCGPRASALVPGGYTRAAADLEAGLASLKGTAACLLFSSGYAANAAVLAALASGTGAAIFSDALNHASIVDGARLAARTGAALHVFPHRDLAALDAALGRCPPGTRKLVITDSLFSMDGTFADLAGLAALKQKHGFLLVVDEAHATLVCGPTGGGVAEAAGVAGDVDVHVGTLSKAFGAHGGFACCSPGVRALLLNAGRSFAFSTALPAPAVAAAAAALRVATVTEPWRRDALWAHVARLGAALGDPPADFKAAGFGRLPDDEGGRPGVAGRPPPRAACSPIVPIILGSEARALAASGTLLAAHGLHVPAIRPPTVPRGSARLRVSLSAAHTGEEVEGLIGALVAEGLAPGGRGRL